ncbi:hypothetical protein Q9189_006253 [Teloschistes chrysophthalmus]
MAEGSTSLVVQTPDGPGMVDNEWKTSPLKKSFTSVNVIIELDTGKQGSSSIVAAQPALPQPPSHGGHISDQSFSAMDFIVECCLASSSPASRCQRAVKLILPPRDGYMIRSNALEKRLVGCPGVETSRSFCRPRQYLRCLNVEQIEWVGLLQILGYAIGGIMLRHNSGKNPLSALVALDSELENRLSCTWMTDTPIPRLSLVLVDDRPRESTELLLRTAEALEIQMYVLDEPGHWLQAPGHGFLRHQFLALDMTSDDNFPYRIFQALSGQEIHIHGLTSNLDWLTYPTAEAAAFTGLPHEDLKALDICRDKYRQRIISGDPALQLRKGDDTRSIVNGSFDFPMVVKPSGGLNSEGVSKVFSPDELEIAVDRVFASQYDHMSHVNAVNVEEYCAGPEVDVNFVLLDGEILFVEIADDFPKAGDGEQGAKSSVFKESAMVYPTALPDDEVKMLTTSLHETLLNIGLRTGVYHVEARVANSKRQYLCRDGLLNLVDRSQEDLPTAEPSAVLIEVNARLPGDMCRAAALRAYGVDYNALHLLLALGDTERATALAKPFLTGPQCHCETLFIVADRGGSLDSEDVHETLKAEHPELVMSVGESYSFYKKGDVVPEPTADSQPWIAWLLVFSRESRKELLRRAEEIRGKIVLRFV